jgi:phage terminase large subunit GpA-like protein
MKRNQHGVWLFTTYADELKSKVYSQLKVNQPGPSYCHFPNRPEYDLNYFRMLTAEKMVRKRIAGQYKLKWELPAGRRNEALDCRQYAIAALNILSPNFERIESSGGPLILRNRKMKKRKRVLSKGV